MGRAFRALAGAAAACALALAACGGDSQDDAKRSYARRLDAICADADRIGAESDRRLRAVRRQAGSGRKLANGIANVVADLLPRIRSDEAKLRRLRPPASERRFHATFVAQTKRIDDLFSAGGGAAFKLDPQAYAEAGRRIAALSARRDRLVKRHGGFEHCGNR